MRIICVYRRLGFRYVMHIAFRLLLVIAIGVLGISCETTDTQKSGSGATANHKPSFDYWQNGGGACCPQHANEFASKSKRR